MKTFMAALGVALLLATPVSSKMLGGNGASNVVDAFHKALEQGDGEAALAQLDDQVQIYEQGWVEHSKAEYAASHLESDLKFAQTTTSSETSRRIEVLDDVAYVTSEGRIKGTFENKSVNSITLETMILRHSDNRWRIVHIHWSSRKPKP